MTPPVPMMMAAAPPPVCGGAPVEGYDDSEIDECDDEFVGQVVCPKPGGGHEESPADSEKVTETPKSTTTHGTTEDNDIMTTAITMDPTKLPSVLDTAFESLDTTYSAAKTSVIEVGTKWLRTMRRTFLGKETTTSFSSEDLRTEKER